MKSTTFKGSISTGKNAISFDGVDGAHIHIDAPENQCGNIAPLVMARGKVVSVTVEWENGEESEG